MASERWYFTKEQLYNSPSRKCGLDPDKELAHRQQAANFIQDMGQRLQVTQLCINTAIVYMHRFYMFHSFTQFHRNAIATAALFLAAKVEEQPRKLEHIIKVSQLCLQKGQNLPERRAEFYSEQAQELVLNENILLQTLGFDVALDHPHTYVVRCCTLVGASKDLAQTSYFMASNSLHLTTMCLQYKPTVVACFCIHLACKWSNWEIPVSNEGRPWFYYIDTTVTQELLEKLTEEFLIIFDKCPSRLKKRIMLLSTNTQSSTLTNYPVESYNGQKSVSSTRRQHQEEVVANRDIFPDIKKITPHAAFVPNHVNQTSKSALFSAPVVNNVQFSNSAATYKNSVAATHTSVIQNSATNASCYPLSTTIVDKPSMSQKVNALSTPASKQKPSSVTHMVVDVSKQIKQEPSSQTVPPPPSHSQYKKERVPTYESSTRFVSSSSHSEIISNVVKEVALAKQNEKLSSRSDKEIAKGSLSFSVPTQSQKMPSIFSPPSSTPPRQMSRAASPDRQNEHKHEIGVMQNGGPTLVPVLQKLDYNGHYSEGEWLGIDHTNNISSTSQLVEDDTEYGHSHKKKKKHKDKDKHKDKERKHKKKKHKEDKHHHHHHKHRHHHHREREREPPKEQEPIKITIPKEKIDVPKLKIRLNREPSSTTPIRLNREPSSTTPPGTQDYRLRIPKESKKSHKRSRRSTRSSDEEEDHYEPSARSSLYPYPR